MSDIRNYNTAVKAVADRIPSGETDVYELRLLAAKHIFDVGGDPDDDYIVGAVVRTADLTTNGCRLKGRHGPNAFFQKTVNFREQLERAGAFTVGRGLTRGWVNKWVGQSD